MSIRLRLLIWHSAVFAAGLAGFAMVVWFGTRAAILDHIDVGLVRQADGLELFLEKETHGSGLAAVVEETREFSSGLPLGSGVQLFDSDGALAYAKPAVSMGLAFPEPATLLVNARQVRALTRDLTVRGDRYTYSLWRSLDDTESALTDLQHVLLMLVPAFLVASIAGGWLLSRRALRPVDDLTAAARHISLSNLSTTLPVPRQADELQRLAQAWNEMLSRLDDAARKLRQFTADASHELRTPVALIRTTAELALRQKRAPEEYEASLQRIQEESQELTTVLEGLMELARADAGTTRFALVPLDLGTLLLEMQPQVEPMISGAGLTLSLHTPPHELPVCGDRSALRRLVLLLLENAVKFTAAPGRVSLRAVRTAENVTLEVEDTGIGIAQSELPRIFDRFYQVEDARSGKGAGLGLSIAQWIVEGHQGRIDVVSTPGAGSTFRVSLPHTEA
jgi:signal transduction histidine kinase